MVPVPRVWHPLDDIQAMLGHIHFDPTTLAHAPGAFRSIVDTSKRVLQRWITRRVRPTVDRESLLFHAVSHASPNFTGAYTNSRTTAFSGFIDSWSFSIRLRTE